jgi:hypothetical protein
LKENWCRTYKIRIAIGGGKSLSSNGGQTIVAKKDGNNSKPIDN